jgi:hypothetical protein
MTKGMVAWAAGESGPDFFMNNYKAKADWWGTQHTGTSKHMIIKPLTRFP